MRRKVKHSVQKAVVFFLQKGEPKQTRIDVRLLTSVAPQTDAAQEGRGVRGRGVGRSRGVAVTRQRSRIIIIVTEVRARQRQSQNGTATYR